MARNNGGWAELANTKSEFSWNEYGDLVIKHATIMLGETVNGPWSNFSGSRTPMNPQGGKRYIKVVLSETVANDLIEKGWNIKSMEPLDDQDYTLYYTEVNLNMDSKYEPTVLLGTNWNGKAKLTRLHGDMVNRLDKMRFADVCMVIHPSENRPDSKYRYKGYCNHIELIQREQRSNMIGNYEGYEYCDSGADSPDDEEISF